VGKPGGTFGFKGPRGFKRGRKKPPGREKTPQEGLKPPLTKRGRFFGEERASK